MDIGGFDLSTSKASAMMILGVLKLLHINNIASSGKWMLYQPCSLLIEAVPLGIEVARNSFFLDSIS